MRSVFAQRSDTGFGRSSHRPICSRAFNLRFSRRAVCRSSAFSHRKGFLAPVGRCVLCLFALLLTLQKFLVEYLCIPDEEVFLTDEDFRNGDLLANYSTSGIARVLSHQPFLHGDIRGKAAWKLVRLPFACPHTLLLGSRTVRYLYRAVLSMR